MTELATVSENQVLPANPMVSMIERVAMDPNSDIAKLEKMLEMKERMEAKEARELFAAAFAKASSEFPQVPMNGKGHNGRPYATLKDIIASTRPTLSANGLALSFSIDTKDGVTVSARLMHKAGHVEETSIRLPADNSGNKNPVQSVGSSQTYGQRYTAQAILGLSLGEDMEDDGRGSGEPIKKHPTWAETVVQDMPESATSRDKAEAIADALCAQWKRKKSEKQLFNEWDRRVSLIEGERGLEGSHNDLYAKVVDGYEIRLLELKGDL